MGVYIKGMDMPKEGSWKTVRIYPDGTCAIPNWQGDCTFIQGAQAIPVPPHGRLIDADVLLEHMKKIHDKWKMKEHYTPTTDDEIMTMNMPTIIPAEEVE